MQKIENSFVTFEIARGLSEIGFNNECFTMYFKTSKRLAKIDGKIHKNKYDIGVYCSGITAPTWSQVMDWFRNEKCLEINVFKWGVHCYHKEDNPNGECEIIALPHYIYDIEKAFEYTDDWEYQSLDDELKFHTYEEARISAILKAIEIVKNKK